MNLEHHAAFTFVKHMKPPQSSRKTSDELSLEICTGVTSLSHVYASVLQ